MASGFDGEAYQSRFDALASRGVDVHGEATLVRSYAPATVLDAGCGTGRVALELSHHGITVVGADIDESMLAVARRRAPHLELVHADLAELDLGRDFDVVVMAGNVPLFCPPERRSALVGRCAAHVAPGGRLVAGFQLGGDYSLDDYDRAAGGYDRAAGGLHLESRFATWDRQPFRPGDGYAVSVHRRPPGRGERSV